MSFQITRGGIFSFFAVHQNFTKKHSMPDDVTCILLENVPGDIFSPGDF